MSECCCSKKDNNKNIILCKNCGNKGKRVNIKPIKHLIRKEKIFSIKDNQYFFCATPECDVVYFAKNDNLFYRKDLKIRVGLKETEDPIPVCYCFGYTRKMICDDIAVHKNSTIYDKIINETRSGNCQCDIKNPKGTCCLGDVAGIIREFKEIQS